MIPIQMLLFQHTATRRWLESPFQPMPSRDLGFNTQPPEGGWFQGVGIVGFLHAFQHTATRRWLDHLPYRWIYRLLFQHTATRRWLAVISMIFKH